MPRNLFGTLSTILASVALALFCSIQFGCEKNAARYNTPQAAFSAAMQAYDRHDFATLIDCFSPKGVDKSAEVAIWVFSASVGSRAKTAPTTRPAAADPLGDLMAKHGLTDLSRQPGETGEAQRHRLLAQIPDKREFVLDLYRLKGGRSEPSPAGTKTELVDVKIDGNTASGREVTSEANGSGMSGSVEFTRIDGSWKIDSVLTY